jgi:hypothetical protein
MAFGRQPIPAALVEVKGLPVAPAVLAGFQTPMFALQSSQPYVTSERKLVNLALPVWMRMISTVKWFLEQPPSLFLDLYVNGEVVRTQEIPLVNQQVQATNWSLAGVASIEFMEKLPLPNPANLSIGYHGLVPSVEGGAGTAIVQVWSNYIVLEAEHLIGASGSFSYEEDVREDLIL